MENELIEGAGIDQCTMAETPIYPHGSEHDLIVGLFNSDVATPSAAVLDSDAGDSQDFNTEA